MFLLLLLIIAGSKVFGCGFLSFEFIIQVSIRFVRCWCSPTVEKDQSTLLSTAGAPYFVKRISHFGKMHLYLFLVINVFVLVLRAVWSQSCVQCGWPSVLQAHRQYATCALHAKHIGAIRGHCSSIMSQWRCHCYFYVWCMCWRSKKHRVLSMPVA